MGYRLGLDVGTTSIGWCLLELDDSNEPISVANAGVRIFSSGRDDKTKEPLSVARRNARGARRRRDRFKSRQQKLMDCLTQFGLMPSERSMRKQLETLDPYELRTKSLDQEVTLHELGRTLFHINQRRGFKSNRKDLTKDKESGAINSAIKEFRNKLEKNNVRTIGEYLCKLKNDNNPIRIRPNQIKGKNSYDFYPERGMLRDEVEKIWEEQAKHHSELTGEKYKKIIDIIFFQRDLRAQEVGFCTFENGERRARLALPISQKFRILQEVNNLDFVNYYSANPHHLTVEQKRIIKDELLRKGKDKLTFKAIRKRLNLPDDYKFNLETEKRDSLNGDKTAKILSNKDFFGENWWSLQENQKTEIVKKIFGDKSNQNDANEKILNDDELIVWLQNKFNVKKENAEKIANATLTDGYGNLSEKAMQKIMPFLEAGDLYSEVCGKAGYNHSDLTGNKVWQRLPYYGEVDVLQKSIIPGKRKEEDKNFPEKFYGKINNPTVHIGLNQLRKLVNAIVDKYGRPQEIVIELARDLKNSADKIKEEQSRNTKENKRIAEELAKSNISNSYDNRMKYKLWEDLAKNDLERHCPFTGKQISISELFSSEIEIEHLLPYSKTFDDSRANKVICYRQANRDKGERSPYEAFGHSPAGYEWEKIIEWAQNLPGNKKWRFAPDAMEKFTGENEPIARQLTDTQHFAKVARQYLAALYNSEDEKTRSNVWSVKGRMTAMLRHEWGLNKVLNDNGRNEKNRADHRHHAIDAFVVACTSRSTLQKLTHAAENAYQYNRLVKDMEPPFPQFDYENFNNAIAKIIVSYKPDHGNAQAAIKDKSKPKTIAKLHDETAYGYVCESRKKGKVIISNRVPLQLLEKRNNIDEIADIAIREELKAAMENVDDDKKNKKNWQEALAKFSTHKWDKVQSTWGEIRKVPIKKVRLHFEKTAKTLKGIYQPYEKGNSGVKPYKYYATSGNYCMEIFCPQKGEKIGKWQAEVISNFDAHKKDFIPEWHRKYPTAKLVMRLQIDDMVAYEENGQTEIRRVKKIDMPKSIIYLRSHEIAQEEQDKLCWKPSANRLQLKNARRIAVDILGSINPRKQKDMHK